MPLKNNSKYKEIKKKKTKIGLKEIIGNFLGDPEVNNSPSNEGSAGVIPDWGAKIPHVPRGQKKNKIQSRNNIVTNSIKTLKMVHIKKNLKKIKFFKIKL